MKKIYNDNDASSCYYFRYSSESRLELIVSQPHCVKKNLNSGTATVTATEIATVTVTAIAIATGTGNATAAFFFYRAVGPFKLWVRRSKHRTHQHDIETQRCANYIINNFIQSAQNNTYILR